MFKYKYDELIEPCFKAIKQLGGSATNLEIREKLIEILKLGEEEIDDIHRNSTTKVDYRTAWSRNYLKNAGYIVSSARAVWSLTDKGNKVESVNKEYVKKKAKIKSDEEQQEYNSIRSKNNNTFYDSNSDVDDLNWQTRLLEVIKGVTPEKFEKLCQRILRELGFNNVVVTGKSHDGGIDGMGILKLGEVLSFRVAFQAKRYDGKS